MWKPNCGRKYRSKQQNSHRHHLKGIHTRSDTNRTGAKGLSFYYPRLLNCLNQMLVVVLLSQHRVSSSKTVTPHAPCGARCIEHAVSTWSAVCSEVPHSQFGEGARPHLRMDEWNCPTPVCRQLSLTQAVQDKPIQQQAWHWSWAHCALCVVFTLSLPKVTDEMLCYKFFFKKYITLFVIFVEV